MDLPISSPTVVSSPAGTAPPQVITDTGGAFGFAGVLSAALPQPAPATPVITAPPAPTGPSNMAGLMSPALPPSGDAQPQVVPTLPDLQLQVTPPPAGVQFQGASSQADIQAQVMQVPALDAQPLDAAAPPADHLVKASLAGGQPVAMQVAPEPSGTPVTAQEPQQPEDEVPAETPGASPAEPPVAHERRPAQEAEGRDEAGNPVESKPGPDVPPEIEQRASDAAVPVIPPPPAALIQHAHAIVARAEAASERPQAADVAEDRWSAEVAPERGEAMAPQTRAAAQAVDHPTSRKPLVGGDDAGGVAGLTGGRTDEFPREGLAPTWRPLEAMPPARLEIQAAAASYGQGAPPPLDRQVAPQVLALHFMPRSQGVEFSLQPADLGRVDIKLEKGADGQMSIRMVAEKPEAALLLQQGAQDLLRSLTGGGMSISQENVMIQARAPDTGNPGQGSSGNGNPRRPEMAVHPAGRDDLGVGGPETLRRPLSLLDLRI